MKIYREIQFSKNFCVANLRCNYENKIKQKKKNRKIYLKI